MRFRALFLLLAALVGTGGCLSTGSSAAPTPTPTAPGTQLSVGTSADPESRLLAEIIAGLLEASGLGVSTEPFQESADARQALELGDIDIRPAYTGEAWLEVLGRPDPAGDPLTSYLRVRDHDQARGITWLRPNFARTDPTHRTPPANATFAFVVQGPPGRLANLEDMTGLAAYLAENPDTNVCVDPEFADRPDGLDQVWDAYGVADRPVIGVTPSDAVLAVSRGDCVAGLTTATDGAAWNLGLKPLIDDLAIFPAFVVTPQIRDAVREEFPEVVSALAPFTGGLTTELLGKWNARVVRGEPLEEVAADATRTLLELAGRPVPAPSPSPTG
ncbi:MAG: glycine betaine ABC transporter substrate-binding protein [Nitriliruptorales bacterium]|nr:glycine betaine ABC transporter substrate-binding protein [Nitriliruptorales bacterium]